MGKRKALTHLNRNTLGRRTPRLASDSNFSSEAWTQHLQINDAMDSFKTPRTSNRSTVGRGNNRTKIQTTEERTSKKQAKNQKKATCQIEKQTSGKEKHVSPKSEFRNVATRRRRRRKKSSEIDQITKPKEEEIILSEDLQQKSPLISKDLEFSSDMPNNGIFSIETSSLPFNSNHSKNNDGSRTNDDDMDCNSEDPLDIREEADEIKRNPNYTSDEDMDCSSDECLEVDFTLEDLVGQNKINASIKNSRLLLEKYKAEATPVFEDNVPESKRASASTGQPTKQTEKCIQNVRNSATKYLHQPSPKIAAPPVPSIKKPCLDLKSDSATDPMRLIDLHKVIERAKNLPVNNQKVMRAMMDSDRIEQSEISHAGLVGVTIGGIELQRPESLDESDVTMDTTMRLHVLERQMYKDLIETETQNIRTPFLHGYPNFSRLHQNRQKEIPGFRSSRREGMPILQLERQHVHESDERMEMWSIDDDDASVPLEIKVEGKKFLHPPLPPGWQIYVSKEQNRPFYVHPDFGTTWHCPVVLPTRLPHSVRPVKIASPTRLENEKTLASKQRGICAKRHRSTSPTVWSSDATSTLSESNYSHVEECELRLSKTMSDELRRYQRDKVLLRMDQMKSWRADSDVVHGQHTYKERLSSEELLDTLNGVSLQERPTQQSSEYSNSFDSPFHGIEQSGRLSLNRETSSQEAKDDTPGCGKPSKKGIENSLSSKSAVSGRIERGEDHPWEESQSPTKSLKLLSQIDMKENEAENVLFSKCSQSTDVESFRDNSLKTHELEGNRKYPSDSSFFTQDFRGSEEDKNFVAILTSRNDEDRKSSTVRTCVHGRAERPSTAMKTLASGNQKEEKLICRDGSFHHIREKKHITNGGGHGDREGIHKRPVKFDNKTGPRCEIGCDVKDLVSVEGNYPDQDSNADTMNEPKILTIVSDGLATPTPRDPTEQRIPLPPCKSDLKARLPIADKEAAHCPSVSLQEQLAVTPFGTHKTTKDSNEDIVNEPKSLTVDGASLTTPIPRDSGDQLMPARPYKSDLKARLFVANKEETDCPSVSQEQLQMTLFRSHKAENLVADGYTLPSIQTFSNKRSQQNVKEKMMSTKTKNEAVIATLYRRRRVDLTVRVRNEAPMGTSSLDMKHNAKPQILEQQTATSWESPTRSDEERHSDDLRPHESGKACLAGEPIDKKVIDDNLIQESLIHRYKDCTNTPTETSDVALKHAVKTRNTKELTQAFDSNKALLNGVTNNDNIERMKDESHDRISFSNGDLRDRDAYGCEVDAIVDQAIEMHDHDTQNECGTGDTQCDDPSSFSGKMRACSKYDKNPSLVQDKSGESNETVTRVADIVEPWIAPEDDDFALTHEDSPDNHSSLKCSLSPQKRSETSDTQKQNEIDLWDSPERHSLESVPESNVTESANGSCVHRSIDSNPRVHGMTVSVRSKSLVKEKRSKCPDEINLKTIDFQRRRCSRLHPKSFSSRVLRPPLPLCALQSLESLMHCPNSERNDRKPKKRRRMRRKRKGGVFRALQ